jgi:hypothetical protein
MVHFWQSHPRMKHDLSQTAAATPPVAVSGLTLFGVPLSDIVLVLTALYTVVLIYTTISRHLREKHRDSRSTILAD